MKAKIALAITLLLVLSLKAQELPSKVEIVDVLKKVNNAWMNNHPESATTNTSKPDWLEATYYAGHLAFFEIYPQKENFLHAYYWGLNNNWNLGTKPKEADNQCAGQAYMDVFVANGSKDNFMIEKINNSVQNLVNRSANTDWVWIDAMFMAMPVLARYGDYFNRNSYYDKLLSLFNYSKNTYKLFNATDGLWYRDNKFDPPFKTLGGKNSYWSRGNGWVFGGLTRTLIYLPENNAHRQHYIDVFKSMAQALIKVQRTDGFWNVSLFDPTEYPGPETSGTAFFTYGLAWGVNAGILDSATYMPAIKKAWHGLTTIAVRPDGKVGYVQGVADEPKDSQPVTINSFREYGEGAFLLAGTEVLKLASGEMPLPNDFYVKNIELLTSTELKVNFYEAVDVNTAENTANYIVNNGVQVLSATLSDDKLSVILKLSSTSDNYYGIYFKDITSLSAKTIAPGNGKQFKGKLNTSNNDVKYRENAISIFPNPAYSEFKIDLNGLAHANISIFSLKGENVFNQKISNFFVFQLNNNLLAPGMYVVKATDENNNQYYQKLMIARP